jgi:mono/diheme cytochrome c family protein
MCHGNGGQGDGELAAELKRRDNVSVGNLTDRAAITRLGMDGVKAAVAKGGAHTGRSEFMPRWADTLSTAQIEDVSAYVVALPEQAPGVTSSTLRGFYRTPPGVPTAGHEVFVHQCVVCHGVNGKGDGVMAQPILRLHQVKVRDLTSTPYMMIKTDRALFLAISGGGGEVGRSTYMPHWGGYLTPEHIKDLVAYVRVISHTKPNP